MPTKIITKNGSGAPDAADLEQGELAVDLTNKRLYTEDSGGSVIEVGINPTEITTGDVTATGTSTLTTVDINGGAIDATTIGGSTPAAGSFTTITGSGDMNIDSGTLFVDASANAVGINTISPADYNANADDLVVTSAGNTGITIAAGTTGSNSTLWFSDGTTGTAPYIGGIRYVHASDHLEFHSNAAERMRIDSSGRLLVGTTDIDPSTNTSGEGIAIHSDSIRVARDNSDCLLLNRMGTDGAIANFKKDGTNVGSIGTHVGYILIGSDDTGLLFVSGSNYIGPRNADTGANRDNAIDLGASGSRFDDIYATNGTIQTSDRNEKQDIEPLSEAEQRVAVAAKALLRKFRWKDAVEKKGDDARIHFGIIAQDLQAAFEAEGLDAGRYAMFIHSEWWETQTEVPAVEAQDAVYETVVIPAVTEERLVSEAVLDEEGNEIEAAVYETVVIEEETTKERLVSEAVEAKEAYTRTDTYPTEEEAPEGAVKKSRMGVRYSELLAFIIATI